MLVERGLVVEVVKLSEYEAELAVDETAQVAGVTGSDLCQGTCRPRRDKQELTH